MASKALTDDSLGFLLHRTSPELSCVLSNARLALESLRRDRSVELDVGNGQGQGGATVARAVSGVLIHFYCNDIPSPV